MLLRQVSLRSANPLRTKHYPCPVSQPYQNQWKTNGSATGPLARFEGSKDDQSDRGSVNRTRMRRPMVDMNIHISMRHSELGMGKR